MTTRPHYGPRRGPAGDSAPPPGPYTAPATPTNLQQPYGGQTYYGVPPIKPSHYSWLIVAYFFAGGLASAAQFIATVANLFGGGRDRQIVRAGRYIALAGALASPLLLIADLLTPRRWYNMLRIYRRTSAMSIGSWALSIFGVFSGLTAVAQALDDLGLAAGVWLGRIFQLPAAVAGGIVALYTGTLMAATNLPFAAAAFPYLSSLFASSAASTAAAGLALVAEATGAPHATRRSLSLIAVLSGISELVFALLVRRGWLRHGATATLRRPHINQGFHLGVLGLGIAVPLAVHGTETVTGKRSTPATILAAISALAGGFILRAVFVFGSNRSARQPEEYFRLTQAHSAFGQGESWHE